MKDDEKEETGEGFSIEDALSRLEEIAAEMESGDLGLDDAMARFEEGMKLTARCENYLGQVKLKIERLSNGTADKS